MFPFIIVLAAATSDGAPTSSAPEPTTYSLSRTFLPIRLSYEDLAAIAGKAHAIAERANASHKTFRVFERMEATDGQARLEKRGVFAPEDIRGAPRVAYQVSYHYSNDDAPLSTIHMSFDDYSRRLTVEGIAPEQVDALVAVLAGEISTRGSFVGGFTFRTLGGAILLFIAILIVGATRSVDAANRSVRVAFFLTALGIVAAVFFFPWERWLPGTAVCVEEPGFIVRYAPQFTFAGFLLALIALGVPAGRFVCRRYCHPHPDSAADESVPNKKRPRGRG